MARPCGKHIQPPTTLEACEHNFRATHSMCGENGERCEFSSGHHGFEAMATDAKSHLHSVLDHDRHDRHEDRHSASSPKTKVHCSLRKDNEYSAANARGHDVCVCSYPQPGLNLHTQVTFEEMGGIMYSEKAQVYKHELCTTEAGALTPQQALMKSLAAKEKKQEEASKEADVGVHCSVTNRFATSHYVDSLSELRGIPVPTVEKNGDCRCPAGTSATRFGEGEHVGAKWGTFCVTRAQESQLASGHSPTLLISGTGLKQKQK